MNFAEHLMALRKQRGWSQEELGNQIGVTRQTVSKWEMGQSTPELEKLAANGQPLSHSASANREATNGQSTQGEHSKAGAAQGQKQIFPMMLRPYDRQAAVDYAHRWAYHRNPDFYNFDELGGDCTNFASQC